MQRKDCEPLPTSDGIVEYDVTDTTCQFLCILTCPLHFLPLVPGVMGKKTITLEKEEAVYHNKCWCYDVNTRRPYGELGSVDAVTCCCFKGIGSGLTKDMPFFPRGGCDGSYVSTIVADMKSRQQLRGDQAQIQKTELLLHEVSAIRKDVSAIMAHLQIPPADNSIER